MKYSKRSFAIVSLLFAVLLSPSIGTLNARDADLASRTFAAAQTTKQQCINTCRARYRDCRRLNQLPSSECRGVYQDCTQYTVMVVLDDPRAFCRRQRRRQRSTSPPLQSLLTHADEVIESTFFCCGASCPLLAQSRHGVGVRP